MVFRTINNLPDPAHLIDNFKTTKLDYGCLQHVDYIVQ